MEFRCEQSKCDFVAVLKRGVKIEMVGGVWVVDWQKAMMKQAERKAGDRLEPSLR